MAKSNESDKYDLMKILVATDIHLGYNETDSIRGDDSFNTFEEILQQAVAKDADFILLGGDLFHDAKPSINSLEKCVKLLRKYTLGDKPIQIEFLSDQNINFPDAHNQTVNYVDPNTNVSMPVFSIHGNHDDISGLVPINPLKLLSSTNLINYFGRCVDLTQVNIKPLLMRKGQTKLALYGLGHIHDNRLIRLCLDGKVTFEKPDAETGPWFNILVLHQNRANRGPKNYLPEDVLPDFLDLIIWGHEHDCRIWPELNTIRQFHVSQPGSSVATSLSEGEADEKHIGLLHIRQNDFTMEPIKLKTVRPFIFETVSLAKLVDDLELDIGDTTGKIEKFAYDKVMDMIKAAKELETGHPVQPKLPLIRLRINYSNKCDTFNTIRFGQQFQSIVANPVDIVTFKKQIIRNKNGSDKYDDNFQPTNNALDMDNFRMEDVLLAQLEKGDMQILCPQSSVNIFQLLTSGEDAAAKKIVEFYREKALECLMEKMPTTEEIPEMMANFHSLIPSHYDDMLKMQSKQENSEQNNSKGGSRQSSIAINRTTANPDPNTNLTTNGGSSTARGGRGGRGRGRAAKNQSESNRTAAVTRANKSSRATYISDSDSD